MLLLSPTNVRRSILRGKKKQAVLKNESYDSNYLQYYNI